MADERPVEGSRGLRARYVIREGKLVQVPVVREPERLAYIQSEEIAPWPAFPPPPPTWGMVNGQPIGRLTEGSWERPRFPTEMMAGPIVGWRLWRVTKKHKLQSLAYSHIWQPGKPMVGDPRPGNSQGVYAMKARADVEWPTEDDTVLGEVALWGRIIEHEHGYRAQYGYPLRLHMRAASPMPKFPMPGFPRGQRGEPDVARALHEKYGIEVLI